MSTELKPCPFCSSEAYTVNGCGVIGCEICGIYLPTPSAWNTRADGWISVDVHGIEWHCLVAVPLDNDEFYINAVSVSEEGDLFDMDGSYIGYHASQVSHWMPLPSTPKVK
ncbi:MAG: DUF551 domain-containing protein [Phocaeicola sp.]